VSRFKQVKKLRKNNKILKLRINTLKKTGKDYNLANRKEIKAEPQHYYKYINQSTLKIILKNKSIRFTNPLLFNDPMDSTIPRLKLNSEELIDKIKNEIYNEYPELKEHNSSLNTLLHGNKKEFDREIERFSDKLLSGWLNIISNFRILSLTIKPDNLLMWSHYADQHRGVVVKFSKKPSFGTPKKVDYKNGNQSLNNSFNLMASSAFKREFTEGLNQKDIDSLSDETVESMKEYFFMKMSEWKYENEYRIVYSRDHERVVTVGSNLDVVKINDDDIEEVIIGSSVSPLRAQRLAKIIKARLPKSQVSVKKHTRVGWKLKEHDL
jgi:hypothetical protein